MVRTKPETAAPAPKKARGTRAGNASPDAPPAAAVAKPFIKWVGGKRQLIGELAKHCPGTYGTYHEPFVGGGALFFHLRPERAVLSDNNERLVRTYIGVRDSVDRVIELLRSYEHDKAFFLKLRAQAIDEKTDAEVAAWFIYLNRTGYNGLYRVNSRNLFNVPFGDYANPKICDEPNLRACAAALAHADIFFEPFDSVEERAKSGDFVYFDPPYVPLSASSMFTSYTAEGFDVDDQKRLRDVARRLKKRGVKVLLSNSSAGLVRDLYKGKAFELHEVMATRAVNSKASGRGKIPELVIS